MNPDDFDQRKTGRFRVPVEEDPKGEARDEEATQKRQPPLARPSKDPKDDRSFDRRKTNLFLRPILFPEPEPAPQVEEVATQEGDREAEATTGEFEKGTTRRFKRTNPKES